MPSSLCGNRRAMTAAAVVALVMATVLTGCGTNKDSGTVVKDAGPRCAKVAALKRSKGKPTKVEVPRAPAKTLVTQDLKLGTGTAAAKGKQLEVNYLGIACSSGQEFDTSWGKKGKDKDEPLKFVLGNGMVIKGWDKGLVGMKVGGRRRLVIPGDLAYGAAGQPPSIGSNDTLVFVVDLRGVTKAPPATTTTAPAATTAPTATTNPGSSGPGSTTTGSTTTGSTTTTTGSTTTGSTTTTTGP